MARAPVVPLGEGGVPQPFDVQVSVHDVGMRWKKWVRSFTSFVDGRRVVIPQGKCILLLGCAGTAVQDIFDTLPDVVQSVGGESNAASLVLDDYGRALLTLNNYFTPRVHTPYE